MSSDDRVLERPIVAHSIRLVLEGDINPWMVGLAKRRYPNNFDFQAAELWMRNVVLKQPMVFLPIRTDHAFLVALISLIPWTPADPEASVVMVCADDGCMWEAMTLLRESLAWAKRRKCVNWNVSSETAYDMAPLAQRLGAVVNPRYRVELQ